MHERVLGVNLMIIDNKSPTTHLDANQAIERYVSMPQLYELF